MSDAIFAGGIILVVILFGGEPDLMSAIIGYISQCG
jgi:hypothetical protein